MAPESHPLWLPLEVHSHGIRGPPGSFHHCLLIAPASCHKSARIQCLPQRLLRNHTGHNQIYKDTPSVLSACDWEWPKSNLHHFDPGLRPFVCWFVHANRISVRRDQGPRFFDWPTELPFHAFQATDLDPMGLKSIATFNTWAGGLGKSLQRLLDLSMEDPTPPLDTPEVVGPGCLKAINQLGASGYHKTRPSCQFD